MDTMTHDPEVLVAGVDTHADTHTAALADPTGRCVATRTFPTGPAGDRQMLDWFHAHGTVSRAGVEGTGSYGAGLARSLTAAGVTVLEVNRPDRSLRRSQGKSDPIDAQAAAMAVLAGRTAGVPRARDGITEAIRVIQVTRRTAVKARTAALNALGQLLITAGDPVRSQLRALPTGQRVATAARLRPGPDLADSTNAVKQALRRLAHRIQDLEAEIAQATNELDKLTQQAAPELRAQFGVGPDVAAQLLITAGGNPDRLVSEASFAALCGVSPRSASSGKTQRHRLNRGGDRQANRVLHVIVLSRMRYHQPTRDYVARRAAENKPITDIMRCLKRYIARELTPILRRALTETPHAQAA